VDLADGTGLVLTGRLSRHTHPWLADHAVAGRVLLPGTAFVELALHAGRQVGSGRIEELTLQAPLIVPEHGGVRLQLAVGTEDDSGRREIAVHSRVEHGDVTADWTRHAIGTLLREDLATAPQGPDELSGAWPPPGAAPVDVTGFYDRLTERGYAYGPAFRGLEAAWRGGESVVYAEVRLPDYGQEQDASRYGVHPALLDAALHVLVDPETVGGENEADRPVRLPFAWRGVRLHAVGATTLRVRITRTGENTVEIRAVDPTGAPVADIDALTLRQVPPQRAAAQDNGGTVPSHRLEWTLRPVTTGELPPVEILDGLDALEDALAGPAPDRLVVSVHRTADDADVPATAHATIARALQLIQAWLTDHTGQLTLLTHRAIATHTGEDVPDLAAAGIWGLVRTAQSEHPGRIAVFDLDDTPASRAAVPAALATGEPQLALRAGEILLPRLARTHGRDTALVPPTDTRAWRLDVTAAGSLENLALLPHPEAERPLAPGEVRLELRAAGLNFRDALIAIGLYPGSARIGVEGAGIVTEVGAAVSDLKPGDRVFGVVTGSLGPIAVVDRRLLAPIPPGWSFTEAATVPAAFLTAYYGLSDLAGLKPGERILVHAATGGVGTAAVQLARHFRAEVFGTASPGKWPALREQGLDDEHIASSRTLDFATDFDAATGGHGVDVVLNALAHEFTDASLGLLRPGGRFLEMGKTDVRRPEDVEHDHPGVTYLPFDLLDVDPDRLQQILAELVALFTSGALRPLPVTAWDVRHAHDALRRLSRAQHIGKLALTIPADGGGGTTLITGGTGALGRLVARRLVTRHGARYLLLTSRQGPGAPGAAELRAELEELGAQVEIAACDAADREALRELLAGIPASRPLTAVIHTAGVVDDGPITLLTPDQLHVVLRPKVDAAWHLHELTEDADLTDFVLFSSASGILGHPGQANYAAANTFLDALAHRRRSHGLAATSLAWGFWAEAGGMTSHLTPTDLNRLAGSGLAPMPTEEGLGYLDGALGTPHPSLLPARLDVSSLRPEAAAPLRGLIRTPALRSAANGAAAVPGGGPAALVRRLTGQPAEEQHRQLLVLIRGTAAAVLGHDTPDVIRPERGFLDSGFDSLTAIELRNRLGAATGLRLPTTLTFDYPTSLALAAYLRGELVPDEHADHSAAEPPAELDRLRRLAYSADDPDDVDKIGSASDDEIFDFIDNELGIL
jgi:NADPH:quinone reductase-like Zn-dependent oxidoreductase/NAD(P)-dependent dehydrogenase (short-subunit alcohol dehydrogenase family)